MSAFSKYKFTRFACYTGYVTQAITVNLAPLFFVIFQNSFEVSLGYIATLTLITFLIQIFIDSVAVKYMEHFSYRVLAVSSQLFSLVGLVCLAFFPYIMEPRIGILLAVLIYSAGSGLSEVVLSPLIESLPQDEGSSGNAMTFMHSFYAWGQAGVILFTTVLLKFIGEALWWLLPILWSIIPFLNTISFIRAPMVEMSIHEEGHGALKMMKDPTFFIVFILMICSGASEQAMAQWASMFAEKGLGITKVMGDILGSCVFAIMMGIGRTAHGLFGKKLDMARLLGILSAFTTICYIVCVFVPVPLASLIACGLSGIGVSIMWPGMLTWCSSKYPMAGASMFAMLALGGDIGCSLGPYFSGVTSDTVLEFCTDIEWVGEFATVMGLTFEQFSLRAGFFAATLFPLVMLMGVLILKKRGFKK